ncbi:MAG: T9SS type A sorting domain-containing protein [Bacteroidia bacterium]
MNRFTLFILLIISTFSAIAQITIPLPQIFAPTHQIYLSPNGNDSNAGTLSSPKKTFQAALAAFPFGVNNANNSHSYNEIIFLAGDYYPTQTLSQTATQFLKIQNGAKLYKNVSVRGIGKVTIHGDNATNAGYSTLMSLMGSHIYVKNITLKKSNFAGLKFIGGNKRCTNILVDSVIIEDAKSHGCLFTLADTIWAKNCDISNTCNENSDEIASNCQWGSALKTEFCKNITFEHNKVYRNWGEGINTSLSEGIYCKQNIAYDNYSVNFYLHSGAKGVWEGNLVYNEDSAFWRSCLNNGKRFPPGGFSVANELTCTYACVGGGNNQNCSGKYHCCAYEPYDGTGYVPYAYRQTDSIFIYNNVILQTDIGIWDAFSGFFNYGFVKSIYVENNTVVGVSGRSIYNKVPIYSSLGTPFVHAQNIVIKNNIFTQDTTLTATKNGISVYIPSGTCNGLTANTIFSLFNNRWNTSKICTNSAINTTNEQIFTALPTFILPTQLNELTPNAQHSYWIQTATVSPYITHDFFGNVRTSISNVGAIEKNSLSEISENSNQPNIFVYPNPADSYFLLNFAKPTEVNVQILDIQGKSVKRWEKVVNEQPLSTQNVGAGIYFLQIYEEDKLLITKKLCIYKN